MYSTFQIKTKMFSRQEKMEEEKRMFAVRRYLKQSVFGVHSWYVH